MRCESSAMVEPWRHTWRPKQKIMNGSYLETGFSFGAIKPDEDLAVSNLRLFSVVGPGEQQGIRKGEVERTEREVMTTCGGRVACVNIRLERGHRVPRWRW